MENRTLWNRLVVTAVDAGLVLFLQDPANQNFRFSPGLAAMFSSPVAGVVTKTDLAGSKAIAQAEEFLALAGAAPVFAVSAQSGEGIEALAGYIRRCG
jgi:ethanolamine utilization protein EutP